MNTSPDDGLFCGEKVMMELKSIPRDFGIRHTWFEILPPPPVLTGCGSLGRGLAPLAAQPALNSVFSFPLFSYE